MSKFTVISIHIEQKTIQQKLTIAESQNEMQRKELARLVQIIDTLRSELEGSKREKDEITRKACTVKLYCKQL